MATKAASDIVRHCRILLAEDEAPLRNLIRLSLEAHGHTVFTAADGVDALQIFERTPVDMVILDVMMPRMDGFRMCEEIRKRSDTPIIILTALGSVDDIVHGFELGADDYITKPFAFKEVDARIQAVLRRVEWTEQTPPAQIMQIGRVTLDTRLRQVTVEDAIVHLTPIEYQLLAYLITRAGQPTSKEQLFRDVWGYDVAGGTNLVEVGIRRLREKIEVNPSKPTHILTVRGAGYKFSEQPDPG